MDRNDLQPLPVNDLVVHHGDELLGEGSTSKVMRGTLFGRYEVAVKVFSSSFDRQQFQEECQDLADAIHPGIVRAYGQLFIHFNETDHPAIVFEYAPLGSLAQWLDNEPHALHEHTHHFITIARHIAGGMLYLHQGSGGSCSGHSHSRRPYLHRDLSPANCLLFGSKHIIPVDDKNDKDDTSDDMKKIGKAEFHNIAAKVADFGRGRLHSEHVTTPLLPA
jgi:serine/threonine protein kinase